MQSSALAVLATVTAYVLSACGGAPAAPPDTMITPANVSAVEVLADARFFDGGIVGDLPAPPREPDVPPRPELVLPDPPGRPTDADDEAANARFLEELEAYLVEVDALQAEYELALDAWDDDYGPILNEHARRVDRYDRLMARIAASNEAGLPTAPSPVGAVLLIVTAPTTIAVYDTVRFTELQTLTVADDAIVGLMWLPDGTAFAAELAGGSRVAWGIPAQ